MDDIAKIVTMLLLISIVGTPGFAYLFYKTNQVIFLIWSLLCAAPGLMFIYTRFIDPGL